MLDKIEELLDDAEVPEITMEELIQWRDLPVTRLLLLTAGKSYMENLKTLNTLLPTCDASRAEHASLVGEQVILNETLDFFEEQKHQLQAKEGQQ